jgi:transcriptional regulator with XRE-family HTH domain
MNLKHLGERIRKQRTRRRLRQLDIANALQISAQAVSKWERGENAPDIAVLADLARLLGVSVEWLLGARDPETDSFPATVFCTSVNGYARRAAERPPREVAAWINGICFDLTEAVLRFEGVPIKYVGDGFLGFFAGTGHPARAVRAAVYAKRVSDTREIVVTLHMGRIFLGTVGHPDYARPDIIGETVNAAFLAMPFVAENCVSGIGITGALADLAPGDVARRRAGEVAVLGAAEPLEIYEVLGVDRERDAASGVISREDGR